MNLRQSNADNAAGPSASQTLIPGGWTERVLTLGAHTFRVATPAEPDEVLAALMAPGAAVPPHLADPYWAKLWPAAPLLAKDILEQPRPAGRRVLELGCGSGVVGLAALAAGLDVTYSDYVPFAVELALENARRNGFPHARGRVLDWRQPAADSYDWIVAADVTYDRTHADPLLDVLDAMLAPGGEAWFGDAGRGPAGEFAARAVARGWSVSRFDERGRPAADSPLGQYRRLVLRRHVTMA